LSSKCSNCAKLSNSIHPSTIPTTRKEVEDLLQCLSDDSRLYLDSASDFNKFKNHFQKSIIPKLQEKKISKKFIETVSRHSRTELIKTTFVATNLEKIFLDTVKHVDEWMEKHSSASKIKKGKPDIDDPSVMPDLLRIAYGDFIHLSILLSQMFFALEFSCRTLCSLGCYHFALRISKDEVVQHNEVWKQLKRFSEKKGHQCDICNVRETCDFNIDFLALARIYAYAMKIRQISDYTNVFSSLDVLNTGLAMPPFIYFDSLIGVMETNFSVAKDSIPFSLLNSTPILIYLAEERKKLYPSTSQINVKIIDYFKKKSMKNLKSKGKSRRNR